MTYYQRTVRRFGRLFRFFFKIHTYDLNEKMSDGGFLVCPNHMSFVDIFSVALSLDRQVHFMAKKELFSIPVLGKLITKLEAFPVDRTGCSVGAIKQAIKTVENGEAVAMFPQGHRYTGEELASTADKVKGGAGMVAFRAKADVVPVYIQTKKNRVMLFRRINVFIGKPIPYEALGFENGGNEEYLRASGIIFSKILELEANSGNIRKEFENG